ncbi:MAG: PilZ domain-containing protein [Bacteriovoracaceae bacterium]
MSDQSITDDMEIIRILMEIQLKKERLWVWQKELGEDGKRPVHLCTIKKVDQIKNTIELRPTNTGGFRFTSSGTYFVFSEHRTLAFADTPIMLNENSLVIKLPVSMKVIKGDFVEKLQLVEKENEAVHMGKREAPRVTARSGQIVSMRRYSEQKGVRHPVLKFELYDVSSGGMSFILEDPAEFELEERLEVLSIDKTPFSQDVIGLVRGVREMEGEEGRGLYKVGVQFIRK